MKQFVVLIIFILNTLCVETSRTNIALNKETKLSSVFGNEDIYGSRLANDGNRSQIDKKPGCAHTKINETSYWWAVDLGDVYNIESLTVYNRIDCCSNRLSGYYIYVYNPTLPTWAEFDVAPGKLCYFHGGESPSILNVACSETLHGRYVKIYKTRNTKIDDALNLCEIEIYADGSSLPTKTATYCNYGNKRPYHTLDVQMHYTVKAECGALCRQTEGCLGYEIKSNGTCSMVKSSEDENLENHAAAYFERC